MKAKKLYRYEREYIHFGDGQLQAYKITLKEYEVQKTTPCGHWITFNIFSHKTKFVLSGQGRRFAHINMEFAWESFKIRARKSLMHSKRAVKNAEIFLEMIKEGKVKRMVEYTFN